MERPSAAREMGSLSTRAPVWRAALASLFLCLAFSCVGSADAVTNYTLRVAYIGTSQDGSFQATSTDVLGMAWLEIKERSTPLARTLSSNLTIEMVALRTDVSRQSALFAAMRAHTDYDATVVIGSDWSAESIVMNLYLSKFNVTQISATSTAVLLSDKANYGTFMRTCAADNEQSLAAARLLLEFGWDTIAILSSDDEYASSLARDFGVAARANNATVLVAAQFARFAVDVSPQILAIQSSGARVIYLSCLDSDVVNVFKTAARYGLTGPGYTWLGTDGWSTGAVAAIARADPDVDRGMFGALALTPFSGEGTAEYNAYLDRKEADQLRRGGHVGFSPSVRTLEYPQEPYVYEAAYTIALGVDALLKEGKRPDVDGLGLLAKMIGVNFTGPTGEVRFRDNGDRMGMYGVVNYVNGSFQIVGTFSATRNYTWTSPIMWSDRQSAIVPSDAVCVPTCVHGRCVKLAPRVAACHCDSDNWMGIRCSEPRSSSLIVTSTSSNRTAVIAIPVVLGSVAVISVVIIALVWRAKKRQIDIRDKEHRKIIDFRELELIQLIGTGSFGDVYKARWRGTIVAVKRILPSKLRPTDSMIGAPLAQAAAASEAGRAALKSVNPESKFMGNYLRSLTAATVNRTETEKFSGAESLEEGAMGWGERKRINAFHMEVSMMSSLRHPNVLLFMGSCELPNLALVTEFMSRGSVQQLLCVPHCDVPWDIRLKMLIDTCRGMLYLHKSEPTILHCDLKSANLLVDENWTVKVADFGLTRFGARLDKNLKNIGTLLWLAPEALLGNEYTRASDVYSFGIIMWEVLHEKIPFEDEVIDRLIPVEEIARQVAQVGARPAVVRACPLSYYSLMRAAWAQDMSRRPDFETIISRLSEILASPELMSKFAPLVFPHGVGPDSNISSWLSWRRKGPGSSSTLMPALTSRDTALTLSPPIDEDGDSLDLPPTRVPAGMAHLAPAAQVRSSIVSGVQLPFEEPESVWAVACGDSVAFYTDTSMDVCVTRISLMDVLLAVPAPAPHEDSFYLACDTLGLVLLGANSRESALAWAQHLASRVRLGKIAASASNHTHSSH